MKIRYHRQFKKSYQKRIAPFPRLQAQFEQRLTLFLSQPYHPTLQNHQLTGDKFALRSFSVTGDVRVIYRASEVEIIFLDVGTHNQVY